MTSSDSPTKVDLPLSLMAGQVILGRYTLTRVLGQGGMGVVWLARDEKLERDIALKFLPTVVVNDRASLNDLKRETRRSLELTHPNIVRTYDFLQDETIAGISMEYVDCDTLRNRKIDQPAGVFEPDALGLWTGQLCEALDYAHQHASIVHRDLKPANLLVNGRNQLKVADFGISRSLVESVSQVTGLRSISGTLVYMSPQQLSGETPHPLDDVYSIGATLYDLCTTRPPFYSGDISGQVYGKIAPSMTQRRSALGVTAGDLPANWESTVAACLAKEPAHRPQSAGEIAVRLGLKSAASLSSSAGNFAGPATTSDDARSSTAPFAEPDSSSATVPARPTAAGGRKRRSPVTLGLGIAAAIGLALTAAWMFRGPHPEPKAKGDLAPPKKIAEPPAAHVVETTVPQPPSGRLGSVFFDTEPPRARVKVDDQPLEKAPFHRSDVAVGQHTLTAMADGYEDFSAPLEVKDGQLTDLGKVKLVRSTGWLEVAATPDSAQITVKGPADAQIPTPLPNPWTSDKLPVGDYEISATRNGWQPVIRKVSIAKGESPAVMIDLPGGNVEFTSTPPKAKVSLNGKELGTTPFALTDVEPGEKKYKFTLPKYVEAELPATVEAGQSTAVSKTLEKSPVAAKATAAHPRGGSTHESNDGDSNKAPSWLRFIPSGGGPRPGGFRPF